MQNSASNPLATQPPSILRNKRICISESSTVQPKSISHKDQLCDSKQIARFKNDFIKNLIKLQKLLERTCRLTEENFIPKNIALKVSITSTPDISNTNEFKSIQGRASAALMEYQKTMKNVMVETAELEIKTTRKLLQETVCDFTKELFLDSLLLEGAADDSNDDDEMEALAEVLTETVLDDGSLSKINFGRVNSFERDDGMSARIASSVSTLNRCQSIVSDVKNQMIEIFI